MFIDKVFVKTLLRIDNTNYDDFIDAVIPLLIKTIIDDCDNHFLTKVEYEAATISFETSGKKILDSEAGFEDFKVPFEIFISGSLYNDGHQIIKTATDGELILETDYNVLVDEDVGETIKINRVVFPDRLKLIIANMIQWQIKKFANFERFDVNDKSFSVALEDYPASVKNALSNYRILELL